MSLPNYNKILEHFVISENKSEEMTVFDSRKIEQIGSAIAYCLVNGKGRAIIDDYAHHPDELKASITSVKSLYPDRKLTVAFQPHLYSRTRDFAEQFADALSLADEVILLDIYPAREEPIPGVTSKIIFDKVKTPDKVMISKQELTNTIKKCNFEILLTAGAGDMSEMLPQIVKIVEQAK